MLQLSPIFSSGELNGKSISLIFLRFIFIFADIGNAIKYKGWRNHKNNILCFTHDNNIYSLTKNILLQSHSNLF